MCQLTTTALLEAISKIEEKHRDLCHLVIQFIPPVKPSQLPGSVFRTFLQNLLLKNRGADRNLRPPGVSSSSVLVSLYTVILHFSSEGFGMGEICGWLKGSEKGREVGFLHRGGQRSFPVGLFLRSDRRPNDNRRLGGSFSHLLKSYPAGDQEAEDIQWEEGCMDDEETKVTHLSRRKPCCCSSYDEDLTRTSKYPIRYTAKGSAAHCSSMPLPESSSHVTTECTAGNLTDDISDKPSSSYQSESDFSYCPVQHTSFIPREGIMSSATLREEELLDVLLLLYHVGLAPNFKQVKGKPRCASAPRLAGVGGEMSHMPHIS